MRHRKDHVIPAKAGIVGRKIPAFAGMTLAMLFFVLAPVNVFAQSPDETAFTNGIDAEKHSNYAEAMKQYRLAAGHRNAPAMLRIGELYHTGRGVTEDDAEALKWYIKAAGTGKAGDPTTIAATNSAGWLYLSGAAGVPRDPVKAMTWYRKAADAGNATGQTQVGWIYAHFDPKNYASAMEWYLKAAAQDDPAAENDIGFLYENGRGVARDYSAAMTWYAKAAIQHYPRAMYHIGLLYDQGLGVKQDPEKAHGFIGKAADAGDPEAVKWLADHK